MNSVDRHYSLDIALNEMRDVMNHNDHVYLLRKGIPAPGGVWADFGSGAGAFTLALADLIGPTGHIYSVDKNGSALREQERAMRSRFPNTTVHYLSADFTLRLDIEPLDGIVMANSLHYVRKKDPVLQLIRSYLKPAGRLLRHAESVKSGDLEGGYGAEHGCHRRVKPDRHLSGIRDVVYM